MEYYYKVHLPNNKQLLLFLNLLFYIMKIYFLLLIVLIIQASFCVAGKPVCYNFLLLLILILQEHSYTPLSYFVYYLIHLKVQILIFSIFSPYILLLIHFKYYFFLPHLCYIFRSLLPFIEIFNWSCIFILLIW